MAPLSFIVLMPSSRVVATPQTTNNMRKRLLSFTLLLLAGLTAVQAYDFSAVAPTGQTLFYTIDTVTNTTVSVVGFDNTQPLGNLTIPSTVTYGGNTYSVTSIGIMAFLGCKGLTSVAIPNSVTSIGRYAFGECEGLTSVTMPNSITSIELSTFARCSSLTSVTIPNSVTTIGEGAFGFCTSLTLTIPSSVTTIGNQAFNYVRHIEYHGTATGEPWGAISMNGYQDNDFIYSDSTETMLLAYIGRDTVVTVANTVDTIGPNAFYSCSWLTSVSLPNSVTSIGASAFYECKNLTSMTIPNSVTTIEPALFYGCEGLTSVTIPNSVTKICGGAFWNCTSIASLSIPNSVDTIEPSAFFGDITAYRVRHVTYYGSALDTTGYYEGTPILETWGAQSINGYIENGIVYTDSTKTAIRVYIGDAYRIGADSVTIPNTVTDIYSPGFSYCRGPLSVNLPNSLTEIAFNAFEGCTGLTSIIIPDSVTFIGMSAFAGCTNLQEVKLPNAPAWIVNNAFAGCTSLTSLTIPNLISEIGAAFGGCTGLTSLYYEADSCLNISPSAFRNDTNITQLVIGENVRWIPAGAFSSFGTRILYQDGVPTGYEPIIISPTIISKSRVAPALGSNVFAGIADTVPVYIPCGSRASYESRWSYFSNFVEVPMETLTVAAANSGMGMAEVLEEPTCANGSSATIAATANYGYHFTAWSDGDTANPRTIVVTSDTVLTALFERNEYVLTVVCDTAQGMVAGAGTYLFGDTAHVEAVANEGFVFSHWDETGSTTAVLDTVVNEDVVLTAVFFEAVGIAGAEEQRVALYPNPTTGMLMVDGEDVLHVEVYDLDGRIMMCAEQAKCLDLGQLSAGLYYVRVVCQQGVMVNKVVKK